MVIILPIRQSIKHRSNFVIKRLIIKIFDFDSLEVLLRIKVALSNKECLSQDKLFNFSIIIIHDIIIDISLFFFVNFKKIGYLFSC
jgi:hypothetical protein